MKRKLFLALTLISFLFGLFFLENTHKVNAQAVTGVGISFSSDESTVQISYSKGTWNFVRPDVLRESWMVSSASNPFGGKITFISPGGSITNAINAANPGDIIYVNPGTYVEHVVFGKSGTSGKPIVVSAAPGKYGQVKLIMNPPSGAPNSGLPGSVDIQAGVHDVWLNGFVIEGYRGKSGAPTEDHYSASGVQISGSGTPTNAHITNNVIYNALHCGIKGGDAVIMEGNVIFENGTQVNLEDHGIYNGHVDTQIIGNIVFNNATYGIHAYNALYTGDVNGSNMKIIKNISFGHRLAGIIISVQNSFVYNNVSVKNNYGIMYYAAGSAHSSDVNDIVKNNIFAFNTGVNGFIDGSDGQSSSSRNNINDFNDLYGTSGSNFTSGFTNGSGTKFVDPLFVNMNGGDFRLQSGSPLINAGTNVGLPYSGSAPDMGAFESGTVSPTAVPTVAPTATATALPSATADVNGDGKIDGLDYVLMLNKIGQTAGASAASTGGRNIDLNGNGMIDSADLTLLSAQIQ